MEQLKKIPKHLQSFKLSYRILAYTMLFSLALSVLITGYLLHVEYKNDLDEVRNNLENIEKGFIDNIAVNIWDANEIRLESILKNILVISNIQSAEIVEFRGDQEVVTSRQGTRVTGNAMSREFPIIYGASGDEKLVGKLYVTVNLNQVNERMHDRFIMILVTESIKIFIASFFVLFIIQKLVLRHLYSMAAYMKEFNIAKLDTPLVLNRNILVYSEPDALEQVEQAVNGMRESLREYIKERDLAAEQTERTLQEKKVLLKEVHHRVKNNLQVISGLLNLQAHHIHDRKSREIYKESQNRVITMALIHEELYKSKDLARVDFADYVRNLTTNLFGSYMVDNGNVGLELDMEPVEIVVDTAIPCGLIINELISNSLKHAFPNDRQGKVRVGISELDGNRFRLVVGDNGVGLPGELDLDKSKSLGLTLVTVLAEQLGADLVIDREGGTCFTLTFVEYHEAGTKLY